MRQVKNIHLINSIASPEYLVLVRKPIPAHLLPTPALLDVCALRQQLLHEAELAASRQTQHELIVHLPRCWGNFVVKDRVDDSLVLEQIRDNQVPIVKGHPLGQVPCSRPPPTPSRKCHGRNRSGLKYYRPLPGRVSLYRRPRSQISKIKFGSDPKILQQI